MISSAWMTLSLTPGPPGHFHQMMSSQTQHVLNQVYLLLKSYPPPGLSVSVEYNKMPLATQTTTSEIYFTLLLNLATLGKPFYLLTHGFLVWKKEKNHIWQVWKDYVYENTCIIKSINVSLLSSSTYGSQPGEKNKQTKKPLWECMSCFFV